MRQETRNRGQGTLESTLAFICVLVLLFASVKVCIWFAERMARRQEDYESSRIAAGSISPETSGIYINETNYPPLDLFGASVPSSTPTGVVRYPRMDPREPIRRTREGK